MRHNFLALTAIILIVAMIAGCAGSPTPGATPSPAASLTPPPITPIPPESWQLITGNVTPEVIGDLNETIISGTVGGEVSFMMAEGGYYFSFKFLDNLQFTPENVTGIIGGLVSRSNALAFSDGAYNNYNLMSRVLHWNSTGNQTFAIDADGPFQIIIRKLPSPVLVYPAQRANNSSGWIAYYPCIHFNAGTANYSIACKDTKQAPFDAVLKDGVTGDTIAVIATNNDNGTLLNNVSITKTIVIPKTGPYIFEVRADQNASYDFMKSA